MNKLISQEGKREYGEEAAEETKETSHGNDEFEEARTEEIVFDRARAYESAERARSQKARSMNVYKTGTENDPEEEEE